MDRMRILGGKSLHGEVVASGAKNSVLPLMAAALLAEGRTVLRNVPALRDVDTMAAVLRTLGAEVVFHRETGELSVTPPTTSSCEAPYDLVRTMRASYYVLGPLVARFGRAHVSLPGGCAIGQRPVDLHLRGLAALGADVSLEGGYVNARAPSGRLRGGEVNLMGPHGTSVGATLNTLMAAALAGGETVVDGAAAEPEVSDVASFLRAMGAGIEGEGTSRLRVKGAARLRGGTWSVIPDRIEAGTLAIAGALVGDGNGVGVTVRACRPDHLGSLVETLRLAGSEVEAGNDFLRVRPGRERRPVQVTTAPYPGFPTDLQAQTMVLAALSPGSSVFTETIFENRFLHVSELARLGADARVSGQTVIVTGVARLVGAPVMASDLRASAALVLAGLVAEGRTEVLRIYHLDRGYQRLEEKLRALGADVERVRE